MFPPAKALTPRELGIFMDPRLFDLMLVMMTADSGSYTFLYMKDKYAENFLIFKAMVKVQRDIWYENHSWLSFSPKIKEEKEDSEQRVFLKNGHLIYQEITEEMIFKAQMSYQNF